jgi:hypothetical protein
MGFPVYFWVTYVAIPIAAGILAASGFIVAKNPNAQQLIDKLTPYKGFIGIGALGSGVWNIINGLSWMFSSLMGMILFASFCVFVLVGFLLGFGMIAKYAGGAAEKGAAMQKKLIMFEVPIGFLSIGAGVYCMLILLGIVNPF